MPNTFSKSADKHNEACESAVYKALTTARKVQQPRPDHAPQMGQHRVGHSFLQAMFWRDESGQTLVLAAVCMVVLIAILGLSIDAGVLRYQKRLMQNAADAAALAGALELVACGSTANCAAMQTAAQDALSENGFPGSTVLTNCATNSNTKLTITVNNPPCALSGDPNKGSNNYVEVVVSQPVATVFAKIFGVNTVRIAARAESARSAPPCVYFLSQDSTQPSLSVTNQTIQTSCTFYLGLSYSFAGNASSTGSSYLVAGTAANSTGSVTPMPTFRAGPLPNPLSNISAPTYGSCALTNPTITGPTSLQPGTYCGTVTINTNATVTFAPGVYIILGSLSINGPTLTGSGVTFYLSQGNGYSYGNSSISNVNATLSAQTTGSLQGILFFSDPSLPAGKAGLSFASWNPESRLDGILYLPGQELFVSNVTLEGNEYFGVVADYCSMNNTTFVPGTNYTSLSGGNPFLSVQTGVAVVQ